MKWFWHVTAMTWLVFATVVLITLCLLVLFGAVSWARDLDGHYEKQNPALHAWFNKLASKKGLCCSFADGVSIADVDWDTANVCETPDLCGEHYRVRLAGKWIVVPYAAQINEPNRFGPAVVWPYPGSSDKDVQIRCFMPGAGA